MGNVKFEDLNYVQFHEGTPGQYRSISAIANDAFYFVCSFSVDSSRWIWYLSCDVGLQNYNILSSIKFESGPINAVISALTPTT